MLSKHAYKEKLSQLTLDDSIITATDRRICILTGQSSFTTSGLHEDKQLFLKQISKNVNITPTGFPWHQDFSREPPMVGLLPASVNNALQYFWLRFDPAYRTSVAMILRHALKQTNEKLIIVTGSCGIEYLSCIMDTLCEHNEKLWILSLGPVGKAPDAMPDEQFYVIQGKYDNWSKMAWRGKVNASPACGHLNYYRCTKTREYVDVFLSKAGVI